MEFRVASCFAELERAPQSYMERMQFGEGLSAKTKEFTPEEAVDFVMRAAASLGYQRGASFQSSGMLLDKPVSAVLRRKLPFTHEQILELVRMGANASYYFPFSQVIRLAGTIPMTQELRSGLHAIRRASALQPGQYLSDVARKLDDLLDGPKLGAAFGAEGPWSAAIRAEVTADWQAVLEAGRDISGSEASKKWRAAAARREACPRSNGRLRRPT